MQGVGTEFQVRRLPEGMPEKIDAAVRQWANAQRVGGSIADKRRAWLVAMAGHSANAKPAPRADAEATAEDK